MRASPLDRFDSRGFTLTSECGEALRHLLYLFERDEAIRLLRVG